MEAAIGSFAEHRYSKGSTNRIIQKSGISKGLLFHYFGRSSCAGPLSRDLP
ncbi:TetR/AcrR family transcriptional regulator [Melghirimyces profundicolus]|uniref:TetR/AcrR family transcriptional regulator n=1 Tax=Melghirimyces profundicolus TaxID=1242148 RepID=UPI000D370BDA